MSNKIFISQGTLELSRNRAERRLNAILDNQQKMLSHTNTFQFVDTGEEQVSVCCHSDTSFHTASPVYNPNHSRVIWFRNKYGLNYLK